MSKIIVVANQKGGVAKTSTVRNLSYSLAELGKKVLTVDLDPQSNLTIGFGIIPKNAKHTTGTLITRMLTEEELPEKSEYIHSVGKVDILPASRALTVAEVNMLITPGSNKYLSKLLQPLRDDYDYILIDTNPSLGALTMQKPNCLKVSGEVTLCLLSVQRGCISTLKFCPISLAIWELPEDDNCSKKQGVGTLCTTPCKCCLIIGFHHPK